MESLSVHYICDQSKGSGGKYMYRPVVLLHVYCKRRYFRAAKFSRIKPYGAIRVF